MRAIACARVRACACARAYNVYAFFTKTVKRLLRGHFTYLLTLFSSSVVVGPLYMDIFNITDMFTRDNLGYCEILLRDH